MKREEKIKLALRYVFAIAITIVALFAFMNESKEEEKAEQAAKATEIVVETEEPS